MRRRPAGTPTSLSNDRVGGGAMYGSPGIASLTASSIAAVSRTDRLTTWEITSPCQYSPLCGPSEMRPRDGFKPTSPHSLAGMRIDPPPSLAVATGTMPAATAAAEPPLDPPVEWATFHGFRLGP